MVSPPCSVGPGTHPVQLPGRMPRGAGAGCPTPGLSRSPPWESACCPGVGAAWLSVCDRRRQMPDVYRHRHRPRLQWSPQPLRPYPPRCAPPSPARPRYRKRCRGARPQPLSPVSRCPLPPTLCVRRTACCCSCAHDASRGRVPILYGPGSLPPSDPPLFGALNVLKQQLPQQLGPLHYPLAPSALLVQ